MLFDIRTTKVPSFKDQGITFILVCLCLASFSAYLVMGALFFVYRYRWGPLCWKFWSWDTKIWHAWWEKKLFLFMFHVTLKKNCFCFSLSKKFLFFLKKPICLNVSPLHLFVLALPGTIWKKKNERINLLCILFWIFY